MQPVKVTAKKRNCFHTAFRYCLTFVTEIVRVRWLNFGQLFKIFGGLLILILVVGGFLFGYEKLVILLFQQLKILK